MVDDSGFRFHAASLFPVRILAHSSNYPAVRYVSAKLAGRLPRYYLLVVGGNSLPIPLAYLILFGFVLSFTLALVMLWVRRRTALAVDQTGSYRTGLIIFPVVNASGPGFFLFDIQPKGRSG